MRGGSLVVTGVTKRFNGRSVLDELGLNIDAGAATVLFGASGCGKSTLLRLIAGFDAPDSGTITVGDAEVSSPGRIVPPWLRNVGMLFQGDALWPHLTIAEQVRMVAEAAPNRLPEERIREFGDRLEISALWNRFPGDLSGGEARRAALIRTLAAIPALLLLDEPFAHLDETSQHLVADVIRDWHAATGATLLIVSHESSLVSSMCRLRLDAGRIRPQANFSYSSQKEQDTLPVYSHTRCPSC